MLTYNTPTAQIKDLDKLNSVNLGNGGLVRVPSQFLIPPKLPQKVMPASKEVKHYLKVII